MHTGKHYLIRVVRAVNGCVSKIFLPIWDAQFRSHRYSSSQPSINKKVALHVYLPLPSFQFFRPFDDIKTLFKRFISMVSMDQFYRLNGIVQRLILYIAFFPPFPYHLHIYSWKIPNSVIVPEKEKREKKETKKNSNFLIKLQRRCVKR